MKELLKGILLFVVDCLVTLLFYYASVLVFIGEILQRILRTPTMPIVSIFVDILLVAAVTYVVNIRLVKSKNLTFIISQLLFGFLALALFIMAVQAITHGILMNA